MMIIQRLPLTLLKKVCVEHLSSRRAPGLCSPYKTKRKSTGTFQTTGKPTLTYSAIKELTRAEEAQHWVAMKRGIEILSDDHRVNA